MAAIAGRPGCQIGTEVWRDQAKISVPALSGEIRRSAYAGEMAGRDLQKMAEQYSLTVSKRTVLGREGRFSPILARRCV